MLVRTSVKMLTAELGGKARPPPFFDASGIPASKPEIVSQMDGPGKP